MPSIWHGFNVVSTLVFGDDLIALPTGGATGNKLKISAGPGLRVGSG
jgi:hypothetical protein